MSAIHAKIAITRGRSPAHLTLQIHGQDRTLLLGALEFAPHFRRQSIPVRRRANCDQVRRGRLAVRAARRQQVGLRQQQLKVLAVACERLVNRFERAGSVSQPLAGGG